MTQPDCIADTLQMLQAERAHLVTRMDAIELTLDNLGRLWPVPTVTRAGAKASRRPKKKKQGLAKVISVAHDGSLAAARRDQVLALIAKSPVGLDIAELRRATSKMKGKDRGNALQQLKLHGLVRRAGNTWVKAPA